MNLIIWILTAVLLTFSFLKSTEKTISALKKAYKKLGKILPLFLQVMAGFALIITFVSPQIMQRFVGAESGIKGVAAALGIGSISVMPGFAAFPLCAALRAEGIPFYIVAAFSISLMNVGVVSFPIEKRFLGTSVAVARNVLALSVSIIAVIAVKMIFGD
jgi:uncharacterized membrane protein YraQ (UPF0718 family)